MVHRKKAQLDDKRRQSQQPYLQVVDAEQAAARESYDGVGADLRAARERRGFSLPEIASRLRIQEEYLAALESGRFEALPGPAYAIGFLRSYANALGIDGEDLVLRFKGESAVVPGQTKLVFPTPVQEARRPGAGIVAISLAVAIAGYVGWSYLQQDGQLPVELVPEPPQRLTAVLDQLDQPRAPSAASANDTTSSSSGDVTSADDTANDAAPEPVQSAEASAQEVAVATEAERDAAATRTSDSEPTATATATAKTDRAEPVAAAASKPVGETAKAADADAAVADVDDESIRPDLPATSSFSLLPSATAAASAQDDADANDVTSVAEPSQPPVQTAIAPPEPPALPAAPVVEAPSADVDDSSSTRRSATATEGYVPQVFGSANRDARVVVRAKADAWVQVQGANNELLLTRILRAGDTYMAPDRNDLTLMTGNAGALEAIVDGALVGVLGPEGQVRRDISLDAEKLLGGTRDSG